MKQSFIDFLLEARSHPELNPKKSINDYIFERLNAAGKIAGVPNCFVSFTALDKLGINPQSTYNTPIGIYAYPASFIAAHARKTGPMGAFFAGGQPWANIFSVRGNIIHLNAITDPACNVLYDKLSQLVGQSLVDQLIERSLVPARRGIHHKIPGSRLWWVTYHIAADRAAKTGSNPAVVWNSLFREIGVDGCIDIGKTSPLSGKGIIHTNEKSQAVFFSTGVIVDNLRVPNKYSPHDTLMATQRGERQRSDSTTRRERPVE